MKNLTSIVSLVILCLFSVTRGQDFLAKKADDSSAHYCTPEEKKGDICTRIYKPVIGFFKNGAYKQYSNGCEACHDKKVVYHKDLVECQPSTPDAVCLQSKVCAWTTEGLKEFDENCKACNEGKATGYFLGDCPESIKKKDVKVSKSITIDIDFGADKPKECSEEEKKGDICPEYFRATLGFLKEGTYRFFGNECEACHHDDIDHYYTLSSCDWSADFKLCTNQPVCGIDNDGHLKQFEGNCEACKIKNLQYFFKGTCPAAEEDKEDEAAGETPEGSQEDENTTENVVQYCTPESREGDICPLIYIPTVGFYADGDAKEFGNQCEACHDENVVSYYTLKVCDSIPKDSLCASVLTCAFTTDSKLKTFSDPCTACADSTVKYIREGDCPDVPVVADDDDECELSHDDNNEEDAEDNFEDDNGEDGEFGEISENGEDDDNIEETDEDGNGLKTCTDEEKKAEICTLEYRPVLGFHADGSHQVYGNQCGACQDKRVVNYRNVEICPDLTLIRKACIQEPICAVEGNTLKEYSDDCAPCTTGANETPFFRDHCPAPPAVPEGEPAKPPGKLVVHECTEEEKKQPPCMTLVYDPVCGQLKDGTRKTYNSGCGACPDPNVLSYVQGECPTF